MPAETTLTKPLNPNATVDSHVKIRRIKFGNFLKALIRGQPNTMIWFDFSKTCIFTDETGFNYEKRIYSLSPIREKTTI